MIANSQMQRKKLLQTFALNDVHAYARDLFKKKRYEAYLEADKNTTHIELRNQKVCDIQENGNVKEAFTQLKGLTISALQKF